MKKINGNTLIAITIAFVILFLSIILSTTQNPLFSPDIEIQTLDDYFIIAPQLTSGFTDEKIIDFIDSQIQIQNNPFIFEIRTYLTDQEIVAIARGTQEGKELAYSWNLETQQEVIGFIKSAYSVVKDDPFKTTPRDKAIKRDKDRILPSQPYIECDKTHEGSVLCVFKNDEPYGGKTCICEGEQCDWGEPVKCNEGEQCVHGTGCTTINQG